MKVPDVEAIEAIKAGDEKALRNLFDELLPFVRAIVRNELRRQGVPATHYSVEDITQDIILTIYSNLDKFNPLRGNFEDWCFVIAANKTRSVWRRLRREVPSELGIDMVPLWSSGRDPEEIFTAAKYLEELMMQLGSEEAEIMLLHLEGLSFDIIAERLKNHTGMFVIHTTVRLRS
jgi:RNA polymerase sigma factor (sigma-70 family)